MGELEIDKSSKEFSGRAALTPKLASAEKHMAGSHQHRKPSSLNYDQ
jgi:hypothetical protein